MTTLKYGLTVNPAIYISCIEQFWSTGVVKTINGEVQLHALVDGKKVIITEVTVRRDLQLEDKEGVDYLPNSTIFEKLTLMGYEFFLQKLTFYKVKVAIPTDPHHTPTIIESSSQPQKTQKPRKPKRKETQVPQPSDPTNNVVDEAVHKELGDSLVRAATTTSSLEVEQDSGQEARGNTIRSDEDRLKLNKLMELCTNLQNKVLDLEKTKTTQANEIASLKRRYGLGISGDEEDLGKDASKQGRRINAIDADEDITLVNVQDDADKEMFDVDALDGEEVLRSIKQKDPTKRLYKVGLTTRVESSGDEEDLGEDASKQEGINAIDADEDITLDDIQAKIDVDYQLAERLQAQEQEKLSVVEKATLFQQLLEKRRKHFAAKRAEEKRNKPPTQAQQRNIMCTYLKNMEGKKLKDLKNKSFDSIQKMFDKAFKRVNTFVDFRADLVKGSSKRAGEELEQESTKKQKVDEDKDTRELQSLMEVIPDEEDVAIDVVPLATKSPSIVYWKIHKEGKKSYYQIVRADGKSQMYRVLSQMLKIFTREDLKDLYKLVKAKHNSTKQWKT
ncbi:hypothetical protein Tco_0073914 [Tanacetum coccineum]